MAGASPLLMNRVFGVLGDAIKVAIAAWGALWIVPWVEETFPTVGRPGGFLIAAVVAAVVLEILLQLIFGWPRIRIEWSVKGEAAPLSEVVARIRPGNSESQVFLLKVSTPSGGWLGYQLLRRCMRGGVQLRIRIERALIVPTCELSSKTEGAIAVTPDDVFNGFNVDLGPAPRRPSLWHWAEVRWRDESTSIGDEFNIDYSFHHERPVVRLILNALVWRSTNANRFRVVGL